MTKTTVKELTVREGMAVAQMYKGATPDQTMCLVDVPVPGKVYPQGWMCYVCTRPENHEGPHVAHASVAPMAAAKWGGPEE